MDMKTEVTRTYRMSARADAAAETGERILQATADVFWEHPTTDLSLEEVARRADVSVRTVIRRFGGKDGLMAAAGARQMKQVSTQRDEAPAGDVPAAVGVLVEHYERMGDAVLRLLAAQAATPALGEIVDQGRAVHWDWCRRVFAPSLAELPATDRKRRLAQVVAICDVYTWKLLRRDAGLSRRQTEIALAELLTSLVKES